MQIWEQAGSDVSMIGCGAEAPPRAEALHGIRVEPATKGNKVRQAQSDGSQNASNTQQAG